MKQRLFNHRTWLIGGVALLLLVIAGTGLASGAASAIYSCVNPLTGAIIIVPAYKSCATPYTQRLTWNSESVTGISGPSGPAGPSGATGATGITGPTGTTGAKGDKGDTGATGATGGPGKDGATGAPGKDGLPGKDGATGATGADGKDGAAGPTGATGANGKDGAAGPTGATGADGKDGKDGAAGPTGATGAAGLPGKDGATGATGEPGIQGLPGTPGDRGPVGPSGASGAAGPGTVFVTKIPKNYFTGEWFLGLEEDSVFGRQFIDVASVLASSGSLGHLYVKWEKDTLENDAARVTYQLFLNGNSTPVTCTIYKSSSCSDPYHAVEVYEGDRVALKQISTLYSTSQYYSGSFSLVLTPLLVSELELEYSIDPGATSPTWALVTGKMPHGDFTLALNPATQYYYLDVNSLTASKTLKNGYHPFYRDRVPEGYWDYWDNRGVNEEDEGSGCWQGQMWDIINGEAPMFYLKVSGTSYQLVDGLQKDCNYATDPLLRVNGDYPPYTYRFIGTVEDTGGSLNQMNMYMSFSPMFTLTLKESHPDESSWADISGEGYKFSMALDGNAATWYYLNISNLQTSEDLDQGYDPFYLDFADGIPAGYAAYWAGRGVNSGEDASWKGWMYQIITGSQPMFYLHVYEECSEEDEYDCWAAYELIDGLSRDYLGDSTQLLRLNGDYPLGLYHFKGVIEEPFEMNIDMEFTP